MNSLRYVTFDDGSLVDLEEVVGIERNMHAREGDDPSCFATLRAGGHCRMPCEPATLTNAFIKYRAFKIKATEYDDMPPGAQS